jgi:hypothetical protein
MVEVVDGVFQPQQTLDAPDAGPEWARLSLAVDGLEGRGYDFSIAGLLERTGDGAAGPGVAGVGYAPTSQPDDPGILIRNLFFAMGDTIRIVGLTDGQWVRLRDSGGATLTEGQAVGSEVTLDCIDVVLTDMVDGDLAVFDETNTTEEVASQPGFPVWPGETWQASIGWPTATTFGECDDDANPGDEWRGCGG